MSKTIFNTVDDITKDNVIVGLGEVGLALNNVLGTVYGTVTVDIDRQPELYLADGLVCDCLVQVMHICFPYSGHFVHEVRRYQGKYKPQVTVIHSTVPLGTSLLCGAVHSPVIGIHPHLKESLLTFTKFIGGLPGPAGIAARHMQRAGIKTYVTDKAVTCEAMKILSTTFYALLIEYTKEVKDVCDEEGLPFEMWTLWTEAYNKGYTKLGWPEVVRPNLVPMEGKLGGPCLLAKLDLLGGDFPELIKKRNVG